VRYLTGRPGKRRAMILDAIGVARCPRSGGRPSFSTQRRKDAKAQWVWLLDETSRSTRFLFAVRTVFLTQRRKGAKTQRSFGLYGTLDNPRPPCAERSLTAGNDGCRIPGISETRVHRVDGCVRNVGRRHHQPLFASLRLCVFALNLPIVHLDNHRATRASVSKLQRGPSGSGCPPHQGPRNRW